ncbi:MAG: hypothetical protein NTV39_00015 [Candidatus Saccharibacteria bacterium]|nr:hypothetical protein [Candidatus Saccharibacteria bacterium]
MITIFGIVLIVAPFLLGGGAIIAHKSGMRKLSIFLWVLTGIAVAVLIAVIITVGASSSSSGSSL